MDWLPELSIAAKFILFFALGFENSRYIQAIRSGQAQIGEAGRKFIGLTSYVHTGLMILVFALHWYDYGLVRTLVLFGTVIFVTAPIVSGSAALARLELHLREALWGYSSILIYPATVWLVLSFSWFGVL